MGKTNDGDESGVHSSRRVPACKGRERFDNDLSRP